MSDAGESSDNGVGDRFEFLYTGQGREEIPRDVTHVRVDPSVKRIGMWAFEECEQLEEVELCEGLEEIGWQAFNECKSLKRVRIPPTVKRIGRGAFEECEKLEEVELCEGLEEICDFTFSVCKSLKWIRIPSTDRKIGWRAFRGCEQLDGVEFCEGLEEIEDGAFENCFSLRNISIPSSLKWMDAHALGGCHDIRKLFGSQNMTLNALRCSLEGLPVHQLCYHQSGQPAHLIFEQLQNIFVMISDQVKASIPSKSVPAPKKGNGKREAAWSVSSRKLKARCHGVSQNDMASGSSTASGASYFPIEIPHEIDGNQDCLGMTPLHILACSTKQNLDLYQLIIANRPSCLIAKDKWSCLPIFYAIRGSCSPEILQFLIDSHKSTFPNVDLNWDVMVSTLCRAGAPLNLVQRLLEIKQVSFPEQSINFQQAAQEVTINCLARSNFYDDFPSRWEFMMEVFSDHHAQQGLLQSLLEIQQSFFPDHSSTRWQALCEELVKPLKGWWNPEVTIASFSMFQFLVRCSIPERLYAIRVRKWQKDIECLVERNSSLPTLLNHRDTIHSIMVFYECEYDQLKETAYLIELALWKSKMDEFIAIQHNNAGPSDAPDELTSDMKAQCRINCGAEIIIPNVLPYLIADAVKDNVNGDGGDMDQSNSSEEDTFDDSNHGDERSSSSDGSDEA